MTYEEIAYQYIYVDLVVKNLQRDLNLIKNVPFKIKEPHVLYVENLISKAIKKRRKLKQLMYQNKIKVEQICRNKDYVYYHFHFDRRIKQIHINKFTIKKNVKELMIKLL